MNYKKWSQVCAMLLCSTLLCACSTQNTVTQDDTDSSENGTISSVVVYDDDDLYQAYEENEVTHMDLNEEGDLVEINQAGSYLLTGTLHGSISIEVGKEDIVRLILQNVTINAKDGPAISCTQSKKLIVSLPEGTTSTISDSVQYTNQESDAPTSAIFSQDDLTINGSGALKVNGLFNDAIQTKDTLKLMSGIYEITSVDDGMIGKDFVYIHDGSYTMVVEGDAVKTTYDKDETKGNIIIENGSFDITAGNDGFQSEHDCTVYDGTFVIETGGGSVNGATSSNANQPGGFGMWNQQNQTTGEDTPSAKGLKAGAELIVYAGTYQLDTSDDAIHANANVTIHDGNYTIASGDDGMHADATLTIHGGIIDITKSYEGLEGCDVIIHDGYIQVTSSDDGINAAGGSDGDNAGQPSVDRFSESGNHRIEIHGGTLQVDAQGDGLDANGSIVMDGGSAVIFGPADGANGALDYDGSFEINGGTLVAAGSSQMAQGTSTSSTQNAIMANFTTQDAGTIFYLCDDAGEVLLGIAPIRAYSSIVISSPDLQSDASYSLYYGGSGGNVSDNGLIMSGLSGGTLLDTISISSPLTTVGSSGMNGMGDRPMNGEPGGMGGPGEMRNHP